MSFTGVQGKENLKSHGLSAFCPWTNELCALQIRIRGTIQMSPKKRFEQQHRLISGNKSSVLVSLPPPLTNSICSAAAHPEVRMVNVFSRRKWKRQLIDKGWGEIKSYERFNYFISITINSLTQEAMDSQRHARITPFRFDQVHYLSVINRLPRSQMKFKHLSIDRRRRSLTQMLRHAVGQRA